jgi:transcriptional regulator with XRE-family HTH domain
MLGGKLKELRELNGFVQRQVAAQLEIDTAYVSKMENGEKQLSRIHLKKLSVLYKTNEKELLTLWMADKIIRLVDKEKIGKDAIVLALKEIENK